jgi:hypothetical protein
MGIFMTNTSSSTSSSEREKYQKFYIGSASITGDSYSGFEQVLNINGNGYFTQMIANINGASAHKYLKITIDNIVIFNKTLLSSVSSGMLGIISEEEIVVTSSNASFRGANGTGYYQVPYTPNIYNTFPHSGYTNGTSEANGSIFIIVPNVIRFNNNIRVDFDGYNCTCNLLYKVATL